MPSALAAEEALGLYAAKSYLAKNGAPATTDDLGEHELVGYVDD